MPSLPLATPSFAPGVRVRVTNRAQLGHCRTPFYLRGKPGMIAEVLGRFKDPERLAYGRPGYPGLVLYKVRFAQTDLWPAYAGPASDTLDADIYETWLVPEALGATQS